MILIKANPELKSVYKRLITTMKQPVTWNDVFVITNNILILAGDVRSLIFNFDNRKIYTSILEIPAESNQLENLPSDTLLNNVMNITLYAFGKWGAISGLKVDKDYQTLNALFSQILRPVSVESGYSENNFRFFKNGIQITYEDMIMSVLKLLSNEGRLKDSQSLVTSEIIDKDNETPDNEENSGKESTPKDEESEKRKNKPGFEEFENDYEIGLWHNLCWKKDILDIKKAPKSEADAAKSRIGNNFYITNYLCPKCDEKLYMGVYPVDKELLIDTEEGRVFMARAYSCHNCNTFYTPRPQKLLQEGDIYVLKFDEDRIAYEDYLDILGRKAERTTNPNFNEFESERNRKDTEETATGNPETAVDNDTESKPSSKLKSMKEHLSKGANFFTKKRIKINGKPSYTEPHNAAANTENMGVNTESQDYNMQNPDAQYSNDRYANTQISDKQGIATQNSTLQDQKGQNVDHDNIKAPEEGHTSTSTTKPESKSTHIPIEQLSKKTTDELKVILSDPHFTDGTHPDDGNRYMETVKEILREKLTAKYDARISILNNLAPRQLSDLRNQIDKETILSKEKKAEYIREIDNHLYKAEKAALAQKVELSKKKTYAEIGLIIEDVEKRDIPNELKQETLDKLKLIKSERAKREAEHLLTHMPLHMDRQQLSAYMDKLNQYKEVDLTPYRSQLDQRIDMAEKEEISAMVKRGGKKDRNAWWNLYEELQRRDYKEENKAPFLEKIYDKIRQLDEDAIERICPSIVTLSFADGLQAYEDISQGMFLPELKTNTLEMIQRRLTKLKTDESVQLMRKLKNDMEENMTDCEGFYFYNAREELKLSQGTQNRNRSFENEDETINDSSEEEDNRSAMLCAINGYAAARGTYEYPLMVCDTSRSRNGKEGFVLTPENIFYHTFLKSGVINILDIEKVQLIKRIFSKGIFIKHWGREKEKLPNNVKPEDLDAFVKILDDFTTYLQEKPESRSIEYMAKEKHEVIHCYRCGFVYKGGDVCPKCGSKMNR